VDEVRRSDVSETDKARCGCLLTSTMGLPCACSLAKTVKEDEPIRLTDIHCHWKRLHFDAANLCAHEDADLSLVLECDVLQV
jgi:alpha-glucosidase